MAVRQLSLAMVFGLLGALSLPAQPPAQVIVSGPQAYPGNSAQRGCVRDATGLLYLPTIDTTSGANNIVVLVSGDNGATWAPLISSGINDATSGTTGTYPTNHLSMAIDSQGRLHILWSSFYYPTFYRAWYRSYDPLSGSFGPVVDINAATGTTSTSRRNNASSILVGQNDFVWLTGPDPSSSWREHLLRSAQPFAASATFNDLGVATATSSSAQTVKLAQDSAGLIHCCFYRNSASGEYVHRIYDPSQGPLGSWVAGSETALGNGSQQGQDLFGSLCSDQLGQVHILYVMDSGGSSGTINPKYRYVRWQPGAGLGTPIVIGDFTGSQLMDPALGQISSANVAHIACHELTGDVFVVFKDWGDGGRLWLLRKGSGETGFTRGSELAPPTLNRNWYYAPMIRGTLFPASNNTGSELNIFWREQTSPPVDMVGTSRAGAPLATASPVPVSCLGSSGQGVLLASPLPILGDQNFAFALSQAQPGATAVLFWAMGPPSSGPFSVAGCAVRLDLASAFTFITLGISPFGPVTVSSTGGAPLPAPLPYNPAVAGMTATFQALVTDSGLPAGFLLSNALRLDFGF